METSAKEFDASLGGREVLPTIANTFKFAASRSVEIAAMTESILRPSKTKLIFQTLPVHMRRRVMSHNSKRLPRRLREGHMEQLKKSGMPPQQRRPSRKYRRRPTNLLEEYTRRQRRTVWLETHIWHAKRFHMIEKWGHRLAHKPCDKAFRACYRASSAHCLMQDLSFISTIKLLGKMDAIRDMFSCITNSACGLGIAAKAYVTGVREGSIHIFRPNEYPYGFIGTTNFLWTSNTELWLFIHPAYAKEAESTLLSIRNSTNSISNCDDNSKKRRIDGKFLGIQIKVVNGLNRFRLTGPKSHAVLTNALKCVNNIKNIEQDWVAHTINKKYDLFLKDKSNYWLSLKSLSSPAPLPPRIVIGLTVKDPRLSRPPKRTKAQLDKAEHISIETLTSINPLLSSSPLWDENVLENVRKKKVTNAEFIKHITKTQIVPGEVNEDDPKLQPIPVVLIQRPGSQESSYKKIGYNNGWDIIIPPGYGLPFWITFVMFGGRSGGLRETESLAFERGEIYMPPDSLSGFIEEKSLEIKLKDKYFRRPPSKRVNFIKLAQPSPFICPWKVLIRDWNGLQNDKFFVMRDRNLINELQDCIERKKKLPEIENMDSCLVAIYVQVVNKGSLQNHANICLPEINDLKLTCLTEPHHEDRNAKARREKKLEHRKFLKQLRRQRIKRKKMAVNQIASVKKNKKTSKEPSEYVQSMRELWLPSNVETVRKSGMRETMGYVVHGAFSFTEARSCGVGYVTLNSLQTLVNNGLYQVLVRNVTSRVYRLANFELIKF